MTTVSLKIRLNYNQILELTQQLSDDDKLELSRALAVETRGIKLRRLLNAFKTDEISQKGTEAEVETVRHSAYEERLRDKNNR